MDLVTEEFLSRFLSRVAPEPSGHLSEADLQSFLRGELPRDQAALVVRHLLTRCRPCGQLASAVWLQGPGAPS